MKTRTGATGALMIALLTMMCWPDSSHSQQVRQTLEKRAAHQRVRGEALHDALCASCHDGKEARALLAPDAAWQPGPLALLSHLNDPKHAHHDYSYLAEQDLMAIVQHIRQRAALTAVFDESHISEQLEQVRKSTPCPTSIKEHVTRFTQNDSPRTLKRGEAIWKAACASCHVGGGTTKKPAPDLGSQDTIWRRRATKISVLQGLTGEASIPEHEGIALDEETQIWPLVSWMRVELIPKDKLQPEPEIPMRGYVMTTCQRIVEALPRPEVPDAQLLDHAAWAATLPDIPVAEGDPMAPQKLAQLTALSAKQNKHLAQLTMDPCLGCHVEGLEPMESTDEGIARMIALLLGEQGSHPAFGKTYSLQHWSAILGAHYNYSAKVNVEHIAHKLKVHHAPAPIVQDTETP